MGGPHSAAYFNELRDFWWNRDFVRLVAARLDLGWDAEIPAERLAPGQAPVLLKVAVMQFLLRQKFYAIPELGRRLLGTGDAALIEGNTWHDNFWGRCTAHTRRQDCPRFFPAIFERHGDNWLGRLQMQIRAELAVLFAP